ncbi:hypothetical protein [Vibrio harveyi]|uniref:hypothetical protein n=1 Tax=Vibrio harveyi TaxID=669 RepID=UPI000682186E|nr:hypothetical protein [Vibrio harveyi]
MVEKTNKDAGPQGSDSNVIDWGSSNTKPLDVKRSDYDPKKDPFLYRAAMVSLSLISVIGVASFALLAWFEKTVPTELNSVTMFALGVFSVLLTQKK